MTTNILYTQDKLTTLASYYNKDPYSNTVSVNSEYSYANTCAQVKYNIDNDRFKDFLMENVFKVTYKSNEDNKIKDADYVKGINFSEDSYSDFNNFYELYSNNSEIKTHLAGTLFTSKINLDSNNRFNLGILFEETYITDERILSKVKVELRNEEPLMQSIVDCNGKVYDFKRGVKLSDFSKFLEQKTEGTPTGYVDFNSIAPSNLSKDINTSESINLDEYITPDKNKFYYELKNSGQIINVNDQEINTCFNGYIVFCSFLDNPNDESNLNKTLLECKPYITVIRVVTQDNLTMNFNSIVNELNENNKNNSLINELTHMVNNNSSPIVFNEKRDFIYQSVFYNSLINNYNGYSYNNYYIIEEMIKNNN